MAIITQTKYKTEKNFSICSKFSKGTVKIQFSVTGDREEIMKFVIGSLNNAINEVRDDFTRNDTENVNL